MLATILKGGVQQRAPASNTLRIISMELSQGSCGLCIKQTLDTIISITIHSSISLVRDRGWWLSSERPDCVHTLMPIIAARQASIAGGCLQNQKQATKINLNDNCHSNRGNARTKQAHNMDSHPTKQSNQTVAGRKR